MTRTTFFPPRSCSRAVLTGIALLSSLLVACGGASLPTATPAQAPATPGGSAVARGGFIATLIPLTEAPVTASARAPLGTSTRATNGNVTPRPGNATSLPTTTNRGSTAIPGSTGMTTWTDPDGSIRLQYPTSWRATPAATANDDDLRLDGPSNQTIFVDIFAPDSTGPAPTPDEAVQLIQDSQARSVQYSYTYGTVQDVIVSGTPAKYLEYQYTPKTNQTATPAKGAIWAVQRGDHTYVLRASNIGGSRTDVDAIISSVSFPQAPPVTGGAAPSSPRPGITSVSGTSTGGTPRGTGTPVPAATAPLIRGTSSAAAARTSGPTASPPMVAAQQGPGTFADPDGRVAFQFPQGWKFVNPGGDAAAFFELDGPDSALIFVDINDSTSSLDDAVRAYRDTQGKSTIFTYTNGAVTDVQIGGEPGKLVTYTYVSQMRSSDPPRNGAVWIVIRSGKLFDFEARNIGAHRPDIDAMIASVHFTK